MKIYIGADHAGFELKKQLSDFLRSSGHVIIDEGGDKLDPLDDFPQFGGRVASAMLGDSDETAKGIFICGSGQGMCMAANRFKGIRASLCWNLHEARAVRNDDDSNVLCLPGRNMDMDTAKGIITIWLGTPFAGAPRFKRRVAQLDELG